MCALGATMLRDAGLTVVDAKRLQALERLYEAEQSRQLIMQEKSPITDRENATKVELEIEDEWHKEIATHYDELEHEISRIIAELEGKAE